MRGFLGIWRKHMARMQVCKPDPNLAATGNVALTMNLTGGQWQVAGNFVR